MVVVVIVIYFFTSISIEIGIINANHKYNHVLPHQPHDSAC